MLASDGNPVRHSLLNLAMEEDIPDLLEAMAEECHFVFEDYSADMASTSSIIHSASKRQERRKKRNVDRINFANEPPKVFAYLDENAALEEGWMEGCPISYDDYQKIVQ
ncbi:Protein F11D5.1 b, partial [Aphelenchoides avenae]